ncbi:MAG TPA: hypothetical protein VGK53_06905 [Propionicimonas sp.]|jgi:hypothetical protein
MTDFIRSYEIVTHAPVLYESVSAAVMARNMNRPALLEVNEMSYPSTRSSGSATGRPTERQPSLWPTAGSGWLALASAVVGLGSWIVLPVVTSIFRSSYPVTDTVVMPVTGLTLVVLAAMINVVTFWLGRQRSTVNTVAVVLTLAATVFFGVFVIGEGLGGI